MRSFRVCAITMALLTALTATAQVDDAFRKEVVNSGYIHKPLPVHREGSVETFNLSKKVLRSDLLNGMESLDGWTHSGLGSISLTTRRSKEGQSSLRLEAPSMPEQPLGWGMGRGVSIATLEIPGEDWTKYNRLSFSIYPSCEGMRSIYVNIAFTNEGEVKVSDVYGREGQHEINLQNNRWNECTLEFPELPRDSITSVKFWLEIFGRELAQGDTVRVDIDNLRLETVENPEPALGWQPAEGRIVLSNTGYTPEASKKAVLNTGAPKKFEIKEYNTGKTVFSGKVKKETTTIGEFFTADFSKLKAPGRYLLAAGDATSFPFRISDDVWDDSVWKVLNFIFCERCGYPVPGKHGTCHSDLHGTWKGNLFTLHGGWHDAGDMAQQTLQSGEISYSMLQMAIKAKEKGNIDLSNRLVEEALWGLDFVLRSRLGDGFRVNAWSTNLWTDGFIGTWDDSGRRELDINDGAYENFMLAGIEAYAAQVLEDDPELVWKLTEAAKEDYAFARARYDKYGYKELQMIRTGHAKNTPESQYNASVSWAASTLYELTGDDYYAEEAVRFIELPLNCQCTEEIGGGIKGFFYGDSLRRSGVHYSHKSRDYAFIEALEALCRTQKTHPDHGRWMASAELYAGYLKSVMKYVAPYGMAPSGVYNVHEAEYPELFFPWQLGANRETAAEVYAEQLASGVRLDEEYVLRRFPVWYSFRGNTVVSLSTGKAAAICARMLSDKELRDIAEKQLSWVVGFNPFGQSLIYGEGAFWGEQYNALPGEMTGEIPVGIQSCGNGDEPYWPQFNNATYKEVFGLTASRWMMLVAEM
jgi:Glycosyl hydrolase family 9./N-terminal ig-like domain of cellulase.